MHYCRGDEMINSLWSWKAFIATETNEGKHLKLKYIFIGHKNYQTSLASVQSKVLLKALTNSAIDPVGSVSTNERTWSLPINKVNKR